MQAGFRNRREAGRELGRRLSHYEGVADVTVLAVPRGGVPVAFEVARALHAPLDVLLAHEPRNTGENFAAAASSGSPGESGLLTSSSLFTAREGEERTELRRLGRAYRGNRQPLPVTGRTLIVVDDGLASGSSLLDRALQLKQECARRLVIALPFASPSTFTELGQEVDELICARLPEPFRALALWYEDFAQPSDEEVHALLMRASTEHRERERSLSEGARVLERELTA
jgi:putative phosphoribosyl transferase